MRKRYYLFFILISTFLSCTSSRSISKEARLEVKPNDAAQRQFDYYFYEGLRLKYDQKYDQALETFQLCLAVDSLDAGVQSEMGLLYASIGLTDESITYLEKAVRLDPANWWFNVQLITIHSQLKHWSRAIELTNALQQKYPNKEDVYTMLASLYKETKDYEQAIAAYDRLENLTGIDESLSVEKFQLYFMLNKPKKVLAEIDKLITKFPTEARYRVMRGDIFMQLKMPEQAYDVYQKVLVDDPQNANVYISLSEYYNAANQPDKAMESIVSALKNDHLDVETKIAVLGQYVEKLIQDSTKFGETESLFKLLVDRYPFEEQVHSYYAVFLQYRKRNAEAISEYETMLNLNQKNDQTWLRLIQLYLADQNYKQLVTITSRAIENLPKVPTWYFYRGIAQYQLADYLGAMATYKTALPYIAPDQAALKSDFYAQIGDIYFKLEKKDSAFVNYEVALAANPKNIMVMNNYAYYLSLEKAELKKAERMSAKTVELDPKNSTYLDTYAWILYQQANYSLAKFYIEKAVDNLPKGDESGVVLEHYGDILWMSSKGEADDAKALEMWQKSYDVGNKTAELLLKITNKGWKRK